MYWILSLHLCELYSIRDRSMFRQDHHVLIVASERFSRNGIVPPDQDIAQRTFDYGSKIIRVDYQYEDNGVVKSFFTFDKVILFYIIFCSC